jgi:hypothetical protein
MSFSEFIKFPEPAVFDKTKLIAVSKISSKSLVFTEYLSETIEKQHFLKSNLKPKWFKDAYCFSTGRIFNLDDCAFSKETAREIWEDLLEDGWMYQGSI